MTGTEVFSAHRVNEWGKALSQREHLECPSKQSKGSPRANESA